MTVDDLGTVPLDCHGQPAELLGRLGALGAAAILAFDGDRRRVLREGAQVRLSVERDGPMVVDVPTAMAEAARVGAYVTS